MKLIRNNVTAIAWAKGETIRTRQAGPQERWRLLKAKLIEEAKELQWAGDGSEAELEELADVLEVVRQLRADIDESEPGRLDELCRKKLDERGELGFVIMLDEGEW